MPEEILHRPKQPYRAPDAASFFSGSPPEWFDEVTSAAAIEAAGVFDPAQVAGLFAKCARTGGARMGNTDNMRVLAVLSTQLAHRAVHRAGRRRARRGLPARAADGRIDMVNR